MKVRKNVSLKKYTTFHIGGKAKYFLKLKNKDDLILAIKFAKRNKLPLFVLGGGSNLLVSDKGFKGLVINFQFSILNFQKNKAVVAAGLALEKLVNASMRKGLVGLEWMIGIPGTVGGAIHGNAGAFKKSIADALAKVKVFDTKTGKAKILKNKDCKFSYRSSVFKKKKNLIILSAEIQLKKGKKNKIQKRIKKYLDYKKVTQPLNYPSAGSVFLNPKGFSAAELIEKCNLKGKKIGNVKISEKHANFIINLGKGKAKDVKKLINFTKKQVKKKFKINLREEIQFLGFQNEKF